jgi:hypothetical protein
MGAMNRPGGSKRGACGSTGSPVPVVAISLVAARFLSADEEPFKTTAVAMSSAALGIANPSEAPRPRSPLRQVVE